MEAKTQSKGFAGLRVLSLESRRAQEMAKLIAAYGGDAVVAPSMREVPLESNTEAVAFVRTIAEGGFDVVILLTGVGTRLLARVAETVCSRGEFVSALRQAAVVARGPKPAAALKELGVQAAILVPEPSTWRDLLRALDDDKQPVRLKGARVAVQEYGASNPELLDALAERGAHVTRVPVYEWALPDDLGPLRAAIEAIASNGIDVALFTSSAQALHLLRVAAEMKLDEAVRRAFARILVCSIGPMTSETLLHHEISPDFEPSHPKMGFLVNEAAQRCAELLEQKRARVPI